MYALYRRSTKFFCCPNMCLSHFSHSIKERTQRSTRTKKKKSLNTVYIQQHSTTPTRASPYDIYNVSRLQSRENLLKIYSQLSRRYIWSASNNLTVCIEWTCSIRYAYQKHILQLQAYNYTIYSYRGTHEHDVLPSGSLFFSLSLTTLFYKTDEQHRPENKVRKRNTVSCTQYESILLPWKKKAHIIKYPKHFESSIFS